MIYTGNIESDVSDYLQKLLMKQEQFADMSKFPPDTRVKFTGTLQEMVKSGCDMTQAKAIFFDGAIGTVLGCNDFQEGRGYTVDFDGIALVILEDLLDFA